MALRLVRSLTRLGERICVIIENQDNPFAARIPRPGIQVIHGSKRDAATLRAAGIANAKAIALVDSDDVGNIHTALAAQEINPKLRLVIRMHKRRLSDRIQKLFDDCTILSPSSIAAPSFVDAALGDGHGHLIRVAGRVLQAGPRNLVTHVITPLADTDDDGSITYLPPKSSGETADFVLGHPLKGSDELVKVPSLETLLDAPRATGRIASYRPPRWRVMLATLSALISPRLRALTACLVAVAAGTVAGLHFFWNLGWIDAIFQAIAVVTATGFDDLLDTGAPDGLKLFGSAAMLVGVFLIAILTASVVDDFISARLGQRLSVPMGKPTDHVIVCGLGRVGIRVAEHLLQADMRVVAIERDPDNGRLPFARKLGLPVLRGNSTHEDVLRSARIEHARCVLAVTNDDITNLETGLAARSICPDMPVVLRLFDGDLARRVDRRLGLSVSRSVSFAAAPVFLAAMLGREVIAVVPYGPRVLLIAELPINPESRLFQQTVGDLESDRAVRVIAHIRGVRTQWEPAHDVVLGGGDRVIVVATRNGLSRALELTENV